MRKSNGTISAQHKGNGRPERASKVARKARRAEARKATAVAMAKVAGA